MNKLTQLLFSFAALGLVAVGLHAQPAPKILIVDMGKLYDGHFKTEEQNIKLRGDLQKAQVELERINKEGNALIEDYKESLEQAKNPALTNEARAKAENSSEAKLELVQKKQAERDQFTAAVDQSRQEQVQKFRDFLLAEISKLATEIAKKKGVTLLLDRSGPTIFGISNIIYFDPAYDITEEVMKEINKDRPAVVSPPPAAAAPAAGSPTITVPGAGARK
jgi:outer membrane protein